MGQLVYLKLIPYQLQSLASHSYHKLQPRFYGPFEVLEKIGSVSYKLKLPKGCKLHPVFHVSCLKQHLGPAIVPTTTLPSVHDDGPKQQLPMTVLQ